MWLKIGCLLLWCFWKGKTLFRINSCTHCAQNTVCLNQVQGFSREGESAESMIAWELPSSKVLGGPSAVLDSTFCLSALQEE